MQAINLIQLLTATVWRGLIEIIPLEDRHRLLLKGEIITAMLVIDQTIWLYWTQLTTEFGIFMTWYGRFQC